MERILLTTPFDDTGRSPVRRAVRDCTVASRVRA